jgi:hypothetical protein
MHESSLAAAGRLLGMTGVAKGVCLTREEAERPEPQAAINDVVV